MLPFPRTPCFPLPVPEDPTYCYDPDDIVPHCSSWFDVSTTYPALIIPAKRTAEIKRRLSHIVMRKPKTRNVYEVKPNEAVEGIDPCSERKLVLVNDIESQTDQGRETKDQSVNPETSIDCKCTKEGNISAKKCFHNGTITTESMGSISKQSFDYVFNDSELRKLLAETSPYLKSPSEPKEEQPNRQSLSSVNRTIRKSAIQIRKTYDDYSVEQVLSRILPAEVINNKTGYNDNDSEVGEYSTSASSIAGTGAPSSFEIIGHVARINIPIHLQPYKYIIGRIILDKNKPRIRTVVNKVSNIHNIYRTFSMEVLAGYNGDDAMIVHVKAGGCIFKLKFDDVYWNSRLQHEHCGLVKYIMEECGHLNKKNKVKRQQKKVKKEQKIEKSVVNYSKGMKNCQTRPLVVADVMAGVGPFAIRLASQYENVTVHANDLNPHSHHYLVENAKLNECNGASTLKTYNMDGRAFLHKLNNEGIALDHVIMNLPASAINFLDAFRGWEPPQILARFQNNIDDDELAVDHAERRLMIHVYCFECKDEEIARKNALRRCELALGCQLNESCCFVHVVRDVSPKKNMLRLSFHVPHAVSKLDRIDTKTNNSY